MSPKKPKIDVQQTTAQTVERAKMHPGIKKVARGAVLISSSLSAVYLLACWWSVPPGGSDWLLKNIAVPLVGIFTVALLYNVLRVAYTILVVMLKIEAIDRARFASRAIFCGISICILAICLIVGAWIRR
jgi:hypothetical protein